MIILQGRLFVDNVHGSTRQNVRRADENWVAKQRDQTRVWSITKMVHTQLQLYEVVDGPEQVFCGAASVPALLVS